MLQPGARIFDNHGRGIAIANKICFDFIEYWGNGNEVLAVVNVIRDSESTIAEH